MSGALLLFPTARLRAEAVKSREHTMYKALPAIRNHSPKPALSFSQQTTPPSPPTLLGELSTSASREQERDISRDGRLMFPAAPSALSLLCTASSHRRCRGGREPNSRHGRPCRGRSVRPRLLRCVSTNSLQASQRLLTYSEPERYIDQLEAKINSEREREARTFRST
eukprot:750446-Hanusia_phi.AAC.9